MTFYFDAEKNDLVGNNMFADDYGYGPLASRDGYELVIDVDEIMENGRALAKLREMRSAIDSAIEANSDSGE